MPDLFRINLNPAQRADLQATLDGVRDGIPRVVTSAANKTAVTARQRIVKRIAAEFNLTQASVRENLKIVRATYSKPAAVVEFRRSPIPIMDFKPTQTAAGVNVTVRKDRGAEEHPHWFIAVMKSGHKGVFDRVMGPNKHKRLGASDRVDRLKIKEKFGPTPLRFFENAPGVEQEELSAIKDVFLKNLVSQADRVLHRKKAE